MGRVGAEGSKRIGGWRWMRDNGDGWTRGEGLDRGRDGGRGGAVK